MDSSLKIPDTFPALCRLRWTLCFTQPFDAPPYLGSALRGLLGHGLRRTSCVTRRKSCVDCSLTDSCAYTRLFEPMVHARSTRVPYVLSLSVAARRHYPKGGRFTFEMSLLSPHERELPYLLQAFQAGGRLGLGPKNIGFDVDDLAALCTLGGDDWRPVYDGKKLITPPVSTVMQPPPWPGQMVLEWVTPWRFKRRGHLVRPEQFVPAMLFESLLYRVYELIGERPPRESLVKARDAGCKVESELLWQDWSRYSSRQKTRMQVGGLMGRVVLSGDGLADWWPLLWLGQWLHLGKFTSMGLGRYRLSVAGLPDSRGSDDSGIIRSDGTAQDRATDVAELNSIAQRMQRRQ